MKTWIKYLISAAVGFGIVLLVADSKSLFGKRELADIFGILCDCFTVSGILLTNFGLLLFVSNEGVFDGLIFSLQSFFGLFKKDLSSRPRSFHDFKESRKGKKLKIGPVLVTGLCFLAVAIVMWFLYDKYYIG